MHSKNLIHVTSMVNFTRLSRAVIEIILNSCYNLTAKSPSTNANLTWQIIEKLCFLFLLDQLGLAREFIRASVIIEQQRVFNFNILSKYT